VNEDLLRKVALHLEAEDALATANAKWNQQTWANLQEYDGQHWNEQLKQAEKATLCPSTGCICGWGINLFNQELWELTASLEYLHDYDSSLAWDPDSGLSGQTYAVQHTLDMIARRLGVDLVDFADDVASSEKWMVIGRHVFGLDESEAMELFSGGAGPKDGLTVPQALEKIAAGTTIADVWGDGWNQNDDDGDYCSDPDCSCHEEDC
jgi:hypothetical protein